MSDFNAVKRKSGTLCAQDWCAYLTECSALSPATVDFYSQTLKVVLAILKESGRNTLPWKIDESDVHWLIYEHFNSQGYAVKTRKGYITALKKWTEAYDNYTIKKMDIRWAHDTRPTVDWLTPEQVDALLAVKKTPMQKLGINLMLCMGLRRSELLRLQLRRIHKDEGFIEVVGKGTSGGKWRNVPMHRDTPDAIEEYLQYRNTIVTSAKKRWKEWKEPSAVFITSGKNPPAPFDLDGWGWDKAVILPLRQTLGFKFSNHTLRRTFGRMMYESGADIVDLKDIYGHESVDMTVRYIGVRMDSMKNAMDKSPFFNDRLQETEGEMHDRQ